MVKLVFPKNMKIEKIQKNKINLVRGFTLIELMVATSIFVIIMLAAMSSLFIMLDAAKNSKALRLAMDNVNFTMESMTRSIRMGTNYYCVQAEQSIPDYSNLSLVKDCTITGSDGGTVISFVPQSQEDDVESNSRISYAIYPSSSKQGYYTVGKCDSNGCVDMVSSDVNIERLKFFVKGAENPSENTQPSVYIIMKGTVKVKGVPTSFAVQTLASQRNF